MRRVGAHNRGRILEDHVAFLTSPRFTDLKDRDMPVPIMGTKFQHGPIPHHPKAGPLLVATPTSVDANSTRTVAARLVASRQMMEKIKMHTWAVRHSAPLYM